MRGQSVTHPLGICCYLTLRKDTRQSAPAWLVRLLRLRLTQTKSCRARIRHQGRQSVPSRRRAQRANIALTHALNRSDSQIALPAAILLGACAVVALTLAWYGGGLPGV